MSANCLLGALLIRYLYGGKLVFRPGWAKHGFSSWVGNPWGHVYVRFGDGTTASFSPDDKDLAWYRQLWFRGAITFKYAE